MEIKDKELEVARLAWEESPSTRLADKPPVAHCDLAAHAYDVGAAFNRHALERVVIHIHRLGLDREGAAVVGVIDHQVGVAATLNRAFAREQAEEFGGLCAGSVHEPMQIQPAALNAKGVEGVHAVFERGNTVRDLSE